MFASDALMLLEMRLIEPVKRNHNARIPQNHPNAEQLARYVRQDIGLGDDPILNLGQICEHELGHWLCGDAYDLAAGEDHERMINSFAIHFLAPRAGVLRVWNEHGEWDNRDRALAVGATYRLSWSATVGQLKNLEVISQDDFRVLSDREPRGGDYVRLELSWGDEPRCRYLSPGFAAACVEGYTTGRLTAARTIELLRGTMTRDDLPEREPLSPNDLRKSFTGHGD